jgi:hypothetical protein
MQTVTIPVMNHEKREWFSWSVEAYVYGDYAVHRPHPDDGLRRDLGYWYVTHIPTGRIVLSGRKYDQVLRCARALPPLNATGYVDGPDGLPLPVFDRVEWAKAAVVAVGDADVYFMGAASIKPENLVRVAMERVAMEREAKSQDEKGR